MQEEIAWNLEERIADKENPNRESELVAGDGQVLVHREFRKRNVNAIEERNNVEKQDEGKNPDLQLPNRSRFDRDRRYCLFPAHNHLSLHLTRLGRRAFLGPKRSDWRSKPVLCQASGMAFTLHQLLTETAAPQREHEAG